MAKQDESKKTTHKVISEFRDIRDFDKVHQVGDDVSDFDAERLAKLVQNGHVEDLTATKADDQKPDDQK